MGRYSYIFFFLLSWALCTSSQTSGAQLNQTQANLLGKLFAILESDLSVPSGSLNNSINTNQCNWTGVTCDSRASSEVLSQLSFSDIGISSINSSSLTVFFDYLCSLDTLQYLDLSSNHLSYLPDSLFSNCTGLSDLKYLNLSTTANKVISDRTFWSQKIRSPVAESLVAVSIVADTLLDDVTGR